MRLRNIQEYEYCVVSFYFRNGIKIQIWNGKMNDNVL